MIQRGFNSAAKRITCSAVARLSSERGALPLAHEWLVHSGDDKRRSIFPSLLLSVRMSSLHRSPGKSWALGKFFWKVARAKSSISAPPTTVAPAIRAPRLLPPPPQNISNARIQLSAGCSHYGGRGFYTNTIRRGSLLVDIMSIQKRRALMARIRGKNTTPERLLRIALWRAGYRYRLHRRVCGVRPDIVFVGAKVAVFVDGCFWHMCPEHFTMPATNRPFWSAKLKRNRQRDASSASILRRAGWRVVRFWEHEVMLSPAKCQQRVVARLRTNIGRKKHQKSRRKVNTSG